MPLRALQPCSRNTRRSIQNLSKSTESTFLRLIAQSRRLMMSKTQGDLTIYLKSYSQAWSPHIRSHIREKRIIPTWIERPGFPLLKRLWRKSIIHIVLLRQAEQTSQTVGPQKNILKTPSRFLGLRSSAEI